MTLRDLLQPRQQASLRPRGKIAKEQLPEEQGSARDAVDARKEFAVKTASQEAERKE